MLTNKVFLGIFSICIAYLYGKYKSRGANDELDEDNLEGAVFRAWEAAISLPKQSFSKIAIGLNCNVDLIVRGTSLLKALKAQPTDGVDHDAMDSVSELQEAFTYSFSRGAAVERSFTANDTYSTVIEAASQLDSAHWYVGGNAALMAQEIAEEFPDKQVWLVGPIGPRLERLLHPSINVPTRSHQNTDEVHLIMEYKVGEEWGKYQAPVATRFITSFDEANGQMTYLETFLSSVYDVRADLIVLSGLHLLETQPEAVWSAKLQELASGLSKFPESLPVHLELASMANPNFITQILSKVLPGVSSIGLNEQELAFASQSAGGPQTGKFSAQPELYKVKNILAWILQTYGKLSDSFNSRLTRIHFHSLTYHVIATVKGRWRNSFSAVMAGAKTASLQACDVNSFLEDKFSLKTPNILQLSENLAFKFDANKPGISWEEGIIEFSYSPVLVCKKPLRTVGLGDAISATGLLYSHYHGN